MLAATQPSILTDPTKKANADDALSGALAYMAINTTVKPLDNLDCRKAVEYAVDKLSVQSVLGGPVRGQIATHAPAAERHRLHEVRPVPVDERLGRHREGQGRADQVRPAQRLHIGLSARSDRPNEINAATSIQASLKKVGINVTIQQYPSGKYFSDFAGAPAFAKSHDLGLIDVGVGG